MMTIIQAAELRVKWKLKVNLPPCEHLNLELEWSDNGSTDNYNCIICGEVVARKLGRSVSHCSKIGN
jgi:hypothetical protein